MLPWLAKLLAPLLNEARDYVFVELALAQSLVLMPMAVALFVPGVFRWWMAVPYWLVGLAYWLGPFVLMLHNTSHRRLFKRKFDALNHYIPVVLAVFFGQSPYTYFAHHVGMHHPENNIPPDLSSTMKYRRDSAWHFLRYFTRFFFGGAIELPRYLFAHGRRRLGWQALLGELSFYAALAGLVWLNWRAATVVFVVPFVFCRFAMMAGNWGQHAFVDAAEPGNPYKNSNSCVNSGYNRRCFNDGYHIGHHVRATRHWTEMPADMDAQRDKCIAEDAIVFDGLDNFSVWALLMAKRHDILAKRMVDFGEPRSLDQKLALLESRLQPIAIGAGAREADGLQAAA